MTFKLFLECAERANLTDKFDYIEELSDLNHNMIAFKINGNDEIIYDKIFSHLFNGYPYIKTTLKKLSTEEFIRRSKILFGDIFDYSEVNYKTRNKEVILIYKEDKSKHKQLPMHHLVGKLPITLSKSNPFTKETMLKKIHEINNNKYDFISLEFDEENHINSIITLYCHNLDKEGKEHGLFKTTYISFYSGVGCTKCTKPFRLSYEQALEKINEVNNGRYEIVKFDSYKNQKSRITFCCHKKDKFGKEHGNFSSSYTNFINGYGCPKCGGNYKPTYEEALERINIVNNNRYDLIDFKEYKNHKSPITFYCHEKDMFGREHGEFTIPYSQFLNAKYGCPKCAKNYMLSYEEALETIKLVNNGRFDLVEFKEYKDKNSKIKFYCHEKDRFGREHGEFITTYSQFLNTKYTCQKCAKNFSPTYEEALENIILANNGKYELVEFKEYKGDISEIKFYCHEKDKFGQEHGEFKVTYGQFLAHRQSCPKCKQSNIEEELNFNLKNINIKYEQYKTFEWLKMINKQSLDFYLTDYNIAIECQGKQHFRPISRFGGEKSFIFQLERDINKSKLCQEHGIKLIYLLSKEITKKDLSDIPQDKNLYTKENTFETVKDIVEYIQSFK